jgi:hypothetical protein
MKAIYVYDKLFENLNKNKYLELLHCTDTVEDAYSIWKNGYIPGKRGRGMAEGPVFPAFVPPLPEDFYTNYGKVTIKFRVPTSELKKGYLIWDPGVQKKVWGKLISPSENFRMVFDVEFKDGIPVDDDLRRIYENYIYDPYMPDVHYKDDYKLLRNLGYRGFCGEGRFGWGINYFGSYDLNVAEAISYSTDKGITFNLFK